MIWLIGLLVIAGLLVCRPGRVDGVKTFGFGLLAVVVIAALMYLPR